MSENNKRKNRKLTLAGFLVVIFAIIYVPSFIHWVNEQKTPTDLIPYGVIEAAVSTEATVVRDEEIVLSPFEGRFIAEVGEGERISSFTRIATVLRESSMKLLEDKKELDIRIINAQKQKAETQGLFTQDINKLEDDISRQVKLLTADSSSNNLAGARQIRIDIDELIQKKASIVGGLSTPDKFINDLKQQQRELETQINAGTKGITPGFSGVVSYITDGYERLLSPSTLANLTLEDLEKVQTNGLRNSLNFNTIEVNMPFAKVIKGLDCYIVAFLDQSDAVQFTKDKSVRIRINEINKLTDAVVEEIYPAVQGKQLVVFSFQNYISETAGFRKFNIDVIRDSKEGCKVPSKSLIDINNENKSARIILVKEGRASIREVKLICANRDYAIIDSVDDSDKKVRLYDEYVINPLNIQEGQMIEK